MSYLGNILANEEARMHEFPVVRNKVFLAHAAVCPLPKCVADAINQFAEISSREGQFEHNFSRIEEETRALAAALLGACPEEIAFVGSTSTGLSVVAAGLDWAAGDNVVLLEGDFPANIYPWLGLKRQGVNVRFMRSNPSRPISVNDVSECIDSHTRLVSLSSVHYVTGMPVDLDAVGCYLRENDILFCVDAIQSLGAIPCSVQHVDFLCADAHKWLLGPQGAGVLFVRKDNFERLYPPLLGWKSVETNRNYSQISLELPDQARRYEPGSLNLVGLSGLHAALELINSVGIEAIAMRLESLQAQLIQGLKDKGYDVLGKTGPGLNTGITSFKCANAQDLCALLKNNSIVVSLRQDASGDPCIRVSPHFYNTRHEIDRLLDFL